jgi:hypothetical protein
MELKNIVPAKDFDIKNFIDDDDEIDMKQLATYINDETRVGEFIQNTMYNTKYFLNKQYTNMKKIFELEQEKLRKEKEAAQFATSGQKGGLFSRFFSSNKATPAQNIPINQVNKPVPKEDSKVQQNTAVDYLVSTNTKGPAENANLLDINDESPKEIEHPSNSINREVQPASKAVSNFDNFDQNNLYHNEKEVPMQIEEDKEIRDDETTQSET